MISWLFDVLIPVAGLNALINAVSPPEYSENVVIPTICPPTIAEYPLTSTVNVVALVLVIGNLPLLKAAFEVDAGSVDLGYGCSVWWASLSQVNVKVLSAIVILSPVLSPWFVVVTMVNIPLWGLYAVPVVAASPAPVLTLVIAPVVKASSSLTNIWVPVNVEVLPVNWSLISSSIKTLLVTDSL